jgi:hypothetical protein
LMTLPDSQSHARLGKLGRRLALERGQPTLKFKITLR